MRPMGSTAVMAARREPPQSLDYFPTPPWATRAGALLIRRLDPHARNVLEPAAGEGHMAEVLRETFDTVVASDIWDYGRGDIVADFLDRHARHFGDFDWIVTNPPFNAAIDFIELALDRARRGVAMLCRTQLLEGGERHARLFRDRPPTVVAIFSERVPMVKGRWDPGASTATSYAWFVWKKAGRQETKLQWIEPGTRDRLWRADDVARFGTDRNPGPLFQE